MVEPLPAVLADDLSVAGVRIKREHQIVLCSAHSVVALVEEVARNLEGLGFDVEVVCGAEARTALLGRPHGAAPTIYVVCVQGTLKEQVLRPLRQALATHGGPNQHLFVGVLDLALPLAMVGQIRRFAEALERPGRRHRDGLGERRQWREHIGPLTTERIPTRSYRAVAVAERTSPPTASASEGPRRTGPQTVIGSGRPAKVGVTAKYRAITGELPATDPDTTEEPRPKRKARTPKVRVKAVAPRVRKTPAAVPRLITPKPEAREPAAAPAPAANERTVVAPEPTPAPTPRPTRAPTPALASVPASAKRPVDEIDAPRRRYLPLVAAALVITSGLAAWQLGALADSTAPLPSSSAIAAPSSPVAASVAAAQPEPTADASPSSAPRGALAPPVAAPPPIAAPPPVAAPPVAAPPPVVDPPIAAPPPVDPPPEPPASVASPIADAPATATAAVLATALARRRLHETSALYFTVTLAGALPWASARKLCDDLEIDGVGGFRLPYRRELQTIDASGYLDSGAHWSRTLAEEDPSSAYVLHTSTGQLAVWLKAEPASVACVRHKP